jgi:hypothetical protein
MMKGPQKFPHALPAARSEPLEPEALDAVTACPVCGGKMELVYDRRHISASVCVDCHTGITIPTDAWDVARVKRSVKWRPTATRRRSDSTDK